MDIEEKTIEKVKETYNSIKTLKEEKKAISQDISEEKKKCSSKTGIQTKDLNSIFKILENMDKGTYSEDFTLIAKAVKGIAPKEE